MKSMIRNTVTRFLIVTMILTLGAGTSVVSSFNAYAETAADKAEAATAKKPQLNYSECVFHIGEKLKLKLEKTGKKKVKWKSSNKKIVSVTQKGKVTAKKKGKATITAACGKKKYKCKIVVLSDKKYLKSWCKQWKNYYIEDSDDEFDKVLKASYFVVVSFTYGKAKNALDVIKKGKGTCYSGGKLLVEILKSMGYKARLRRAVKDNMSRYPEGVIFMADHYNVEVEINGEKYYVDGTPNTGGFGLVYLSSKKKPLFSASNIWG